MAQVINTNVSSLIAQGKLDKASGGLATSFTRLSSGLRINSAKDDAAGLAIVTRFTSRISGLNVAKRNANDAISLAQVAEGALEEVSSILQRARELALQSANGSNSAQDRKALQSEVNQLKQELTRISTTTTFNGNDILNGNLKNSQFQIGSEANQTVSISIQDTRTTTLGTNQLTTNNTDGIEQATYKTYIGGNTASDAVGIGSGIGVRADSVTQNGYAAETLTISHVTTAGVTVTEDVAVTQHDDASVIAANLDAIDGVSARAFNKVVLSNLVTASDDALITLYVSDTSIADVFSATDSSFTDVAGAINANTDMQALGVYAIGTADNLEIYATGGHDIAFSYTAGQGVSVDVASAFNGGGTSALNASDLSDIRGGRVDVSLDQGYSIASNLAANAGVLKSAGAGETITGGTKVGMGDLTAGNAVGAQTLTISGSAGSTTVALDAGEEASNIVTKINAVTGSTNVKAKAITTVTVSNLSADGTVSFDLFGDNAAAASISAAVTASDLTALVKSINDISGNTGITAALGDSNGQMILTHSSGKNIGIKNFNHTSAVTYQDPATTAVDGTGSEVVAPVIVTMDVVGNSSTNSGSTVKLRKGGATDVNNQDSVVVGGQVTFTSSAVFSISSNVTGVSNKASLFSTAANAGNTSSKSAVNSLDISTVSGANSAISVLDDAMNQVSEIRADLGAVQSRFESAIRNISNNLENLNIARSRILDVDFAQETAELAKNQILSSAGMSILSQANMLPQNVLQLLK